MIFSESFGKSVLVIYRLGKSVLVKVSSYYLFEAERRFDNNNLLYN